MEQFPVVPMVSEVVERQRGAERSGWSLDDGSVEGYKVELGKERKSSWARIFSGAGVGAGSE